MDNHNNGFTGFVVTAIMGIFAHWTKSDIVVYVTIMAGVLTCIEKIVQLSNKKK